jgi:hypothetical protein
MNYDSQTGKFYMTKEEREMHDRLEMILVGQDGE